MNKIGLMTWFTYNNYGSMLQCKALINVIESLGYDIKLINYHPKESYVEKKNLQHYSKRLFSKVKEKSLYKKTISNRNTEIFRRELPKSRLVQTHTNLLSLNEDFDAFVCGSDQIWSPLCFDENYYLHFVSEDAKKIAYAPSFGVTQLENKFIKDKITKELSKFDHLSVREEQGAKLVENILHVKPEVVLDPTLLLKLEEWEEELVVIKENDFIIAYFLGDNRNYYKACEKIAKKLNKKLFYIPTSKKQLSFKNSIQDDIGPREFISYIKNADLVLTDSFHGTIFSLIFNNKLIVFKRFKDNGGSQNSRIFNILDKLEIGKILYDDDFESSINAAYDISFDDINEKLNSEREKSRIYLENSLKKAVGVNKPTTKSLCTEICTGCGTCTAICPQSCITINKNNEGFYSYNIDSKKCTNCGLCNSVCAQIHQNNTIKIEKGKLYSAFSNDEELRKKSTSGGLCTEISKFYIENNKKVFGCSYNYEQNFAESIIVSSMKDLKKLQGSKYIQSITKNSIKEIKNMNGGLIIGTPCQIGSIDLYLKKLKIRDNYLLLDFICHGVPSYFLWDKYLDSYDKILKVHFRNKKYGWNKKYITIRDANGTHTNSEKKDLFYHFFNLSNVYNRCCYECNYRDQSAADIRVGDYWGPAFADSREGVSMMIPLTNRGNKIINNLVTNNKINITKKNIDDYFKYQQTSNFRIPLEYEKIINELKNPNININDIDKKYNSKILRYRMIGENIEKIITIFKRKKNGKQV